MSERYDFDLMKQLMAKDNGGEWVRYSDYAAVQAENKRLRKALEPFAKEYEKRSRLAPGPDIDHWPIGDNSLTLRHLRIAHEFIYPRTEQVEQ